MSTQRSRYYTPPDLALLWSRSGGRCGFPECPVICVELANENDLSATVGNVAHIEALSNSGPRANPSLTLRQRNSYDNLILLCSTHHDQVDAQPNTYTVEMLRAWKTTQEERYNDFLAQVMPNITFVELATITNVLVSGEQLPPSPITVIPHQDKIDRNGLTGQSILWFNMGLLQTKRVESYVEATGSIDRTFVSRLTSGFITEYQQQTQAGLQGDALFAAMFRFSVQGRTDFQHQSAGLAVLAYLFERCEVFEQ